METESSLCGLRANLGSRRPSPANEMRDPDDVSLRSHQTARTLHLRVCPDRSRCSRRSSPTTYMPLLRFVSSGLPPHRPQYSTDDLRMSSVAHPLLMCIHLGR